MDEGVKQAKEGNFAFIGESVSLDLAVARHCELVRVHEVIGMRGYSIAAPLGKEPPLKMSFILIYQMLIKYKTLKVTYCASLNRLG